MIASYSLQDHITQPVKEPRFSATVTAQCFLLNWGFSA